MKWNFKKQRAHLFLDTKVLLKEQEGSQKYDLILSPSLYWIKRVELQLSKKQIKAYLPSLFDTLLPPGNYRYSLLQSNGELFAIAYDEEVIRNYLKHFGVDISIIGKVYVAQEALSQQMLPCHLSDARAIAMQDGIVVVVPETLVQDEIKECDFSMLSLTTQPLFMRTYKSVIDEKLFYKLLGVLVFFGILFGVELWHYKTELYKIEEKRALIFKKFNLLPTLLQNRALLEELEQLDAKQKVLVTLLQKSLEVPLNRASISMLSYEKGYLKLFFKKKNIGDIVQKFRKKGLVIHSQKRFKNGVEVEVTW